MVLDDTLTAQQMRLIPLLLRVPAEERSPVLDLLRSICVTQDYVQQREECLRRMGIAPRLR